MSKCRILVITPCPTHPVSAGNSRRISNLMDTLIGLGHEPHILYLPHFLFGLPDMAGMRERWKDRLHVGQPHWPMMPGFLRNRLLWRREGLLKTLPFLGRGTSKNGNRTSFDRLARPEWEEQTRALWDRYHFDAVVVEYILISRTLLSLPDSVRKIIDTHDVFADRQEQIRNVPKRMQWFSTTREEEAAALRRAHVTLAIQEEEATYFRDLDANNEVVTVGHLVEQVRQIGEPSTGPPSVMMVSSQNPINQYGLSVFLEKTWPLVRQQLSGARLRLVGQICNGVPADLPGVERLGVIDDVAKAYERSHVVLNPVQEGTGLPIKSIEALMHGKPLVATRSAARSLTDGAGSAFVVGETPQQLAGAIVRLLQDTDARKQLATAAYKYALRYADRQRQNLQLALVPAAVGKR